MTQQSDQELMAMGQIYREFWQNGDPTETWEPFVVSTQEALQAEVPVVMLSGSHGVGKTHIYSRLLRQQIPGTYYSDFYDATSGMATAAIGISIVDEVTGFTAAHNVDETGADVKAMVGAGNQLVLIFPSRRSVRLETVEKLGTVLKGLDVESHYIGDMHENGLHPDRVQHLGDQLKLPAATIDTLLSVSALRNLRVFRSVAHDAFTMADDTETALGKIWTPGFMRTLLRTQFDLDKIERLSLSTDGLNQLSEFAGVS